MVLVALVAGGVWTARRRRTIQLRGVISEICRTAAWGTPTTSNESFEQPPVYVIVYIIVCVVSFALYAVMGC